VQASLTTTLSEGPSGEPLQFESVYANLIGESLVLIRYHYNRPPERRIDRLVPYILDEATGRPLYVQVLPLLGAIYLHSECRSSSRASQDGYFLVDNGDFIVKAGSKVTVVIGEMKQEGITIS
jgi:hypothetical protein